jgi:hypothetical protein
MLAAGDGGDEWVVPERPEVECEPLEVVVVERLMGKGQNVMLEPCRADVDNDGIGQRLGEIDPRHGRPTRLPGRLHSYPHGAHATSTDAELERAG